MAKWKECSIGEQFGAGTPAGDPVATARAEGYAQGLRDAADCCGKENGPWQASAWSCRNAILALLDTPAPRPAATRSSPKPERTAPMSDTHWKILRDLRDGTLRWGAAVGACWPDLVRLGYVRPNFGEITEAGRDALTEKDSPHD